MFKIRNKRETGFEILRILAMFFIICHHIIYHGNGLSNCQELALPWINLIRSLFITSVNIFILISAYFMVKSKLNIKKLVYLFLQVLFYSVLAYLIYSLFIVKRFNFKEFIGCLFPIVNNKYWFFTAYFILMLLSPFLNKILNNTSKKELYGLSILLFVLSYLYMKQPIGNVFNLSSGYSVWWFICLYIFAGTLRLYPINVKKNCALILYLTSTFLLWMFSFLPTNNYWFNLIHNPLNYTSPLVVIASVSLVLLFKDLNIKNTYIHNSLCYISSLTFGIYLIHDSGYLRYSFFDLFKFSRHYSSKYLALWILLIAVGIFVLCAIIEAIRKLFITLIRKLFKKIKNMKKDTFN